jgi:hypothetical protein
LLLVGRVSQAAFFPIRPASLRYPPSAQFPPSKRLLVFSCGNPVLPLRISQEKITESKYHAKSRKKDTWHEIS